MKLFPLTNRRLLLAAAAGVLAFIVWVCACEWYLRFHPDTAFRSVTGRELPAGVRVVAYANRMDDALFHTSHYWMLEGSPGALRQVVAGTGFVNWADPKDSVPRFLDILGLKDTSRKVAAGWENDIERSDDPRIHQFCIMEGGTTAFYRH